MAAKESLPLSIPFSITFRDAGINNKLGATFVIQFRYEHVFPRSTVDHSSWGPCREINAQVSRLPAIVQRRSSSSFAPFYCILLAPPYWSQTLSSFSVSRRMPRESSRSSANISGARLPRWRAWRRCKGSPDVYSVADLPRKPRRCIVAANMSPTSQQHAPGMTFRYEASLHNILIP